MKKIDELYYVFSLGEDGELTTFLVREVVWKKANHFSMNFFQRYKEDSKHNSFFSSFGNFSNESPMVIEKYSYKY